MNRNVPPRPPAHELTVPRRERVHELLYPAKCLEVGFTPDEREIIINIPEDGFTPASHVVFSAQQARNLARILLRKADECKS
jgi:hypothetical protein